MTKYTFEYKLKIVKEYLIHKPKFRDLAAKYNLPSHSYVSQWVRFYKKFGEDGLKNKNKKTVYTIQFKLDVLDFIQITGSSFEEAAIKFNIPHPSIIQGWKQQLLKRGLVGLDKKYKGLSSMAKKNKKNSNKNVVNSDLVNQLEREVELLRLEVAYLKKLKAFRENPNAFLEKKKQLLHSSLNKKDSN